MSKRSSSLFIGLPILLSNCFCVFKVSEALSLRKEYQLGSWRIKWYLQRYHDISISESSVYRILKCYSVERLQKKAAKRSLHSKRYNKSAPGHHVQVDVKVLLIKD